MVIDLASLPLYESRKWHLSDTGYAVNRSGKPKFTARFHRLVAGTPAGVVTDHLNHDRLDNRAENLRIVTQLENMRNMTNVGKGYWFHTQNRNWVVEVWGKHVGCFSTEQEAASVAILIRSGGTYVKPVRKFCKHGHSLLDAYNYGAGLLCRVCQCIRGKEYRSKKRGK